MKKIYHSLLVLLLILSLSACNKNFLRSPEDFEAFYEKFHQDETFQKERIKFPLKGRYVDVTGEQPWSETEWEMHLQKVTDIAEPDYDTEIIKKEDLVIDKVKLRDSGFYSERRFRLIKGKWYLVYFETVNL